MAAGPRPRSYRQKTPKKMVQLALRSALSDRASEGRVAVVDAWHFSTPSTKQAREALAALGIEGKALLVVDRDSDQVQKSFRNLPSVHLIAVSELNAYDVLCADWVVFTRDNLPGSPSSASETAEPSPETGSDQ